jgi:phosphate transport system protein
MTEHIAKQFDEDLNALSEMIAEMGGMAERVVVDSIQALVERNITRAESVIAADRAIDQLQGAIEERAVLTIAKRQPMAVDLRETVAALRISNDLERIGDLAKNIGKRVVALNGQLQPAKITVGVDHMGELVQGQLKEVLDAYASRDTVRAIEVWRRDGEIDQLYTSLFRELLTYMMEDPRNIGFCTHLLFCAKNIERIGDHATNIAETIHYLVIGEALTDERPKRDATSSTVIAYEDLKG